MYLANRAPEFWPDATFIVAHCNFGLRGAESDGDESFVRQWCRENGIQCVVKHFDTAAYAEEHKISIEMAARELRYEWFAELCLSSGRALAVAHNSGDNAETLMLNLLRRTGLRGLRGMSPDGTLNGIRVLRSMLGISRDEIQEWMLAKGHGWREDSTNGETEYKRNKLRNRVFPIFKEINPSFLRTLNQDMTRFCQADDIAEDYYADAVRGISTADGYSVTKLLKLKHWKFVLWRILENSGISAPTFDKLTTLLEKYRTEPLGTVTLGGKTFETPCCKIKIKRKVLIIGENR